MTMTTTTSLLFAAVLAAQVPAEPIPNTTKPADAASDAPALLTDPAASPPPELYKPLDLDGAPPPVTTTTTPPAKPVESKLPPKAKPRLLVMDIVDQGVGEDIASSISEATGAQAIASYAGEVVTTAQIKVALDASALQALSGCMTEKCMADIAETVEADRVLGGSVNKVGDDFLITLILVDPKTGDRIEQRQRKVPGNADMYFYATKQLTSLLLTGRSVDPLVPVAISASQPGAVITLDGKVVGEAPQTLKLDPGDHEIRMELDGFVSWRTTAKVEDATPLAVHANLIATRFPIWPFALTTGVVSAIALGGATYFWLGAVDAYDGSVTALLGGGNADSYLGQPDADSAYLSDKKQLSRERALYGDVLGGTAGVFAAATIVLGTWELAAWALADE
jgi:hypothetical protein